MYARGEYWAPEIIAGGGCVWMMLVVAGVGLEQLVTFFGFNRKLTFLLDKLRPPGSIGCYGFLDGTRSVDGTVLYGSI